MVEMPMIAKGAEELYLLPGMSNRHGLVAGATGTGKTVTLQVMAEALSSIMNCRMAGLRLDDLPSGLRPAQPLKMNTESGSLRYIHSDAGETCSVPRLITLSRMPLLNTMKACLSRSIASV